MYPRESICVLVPSINIVPPEVSMRVYLEDVVMPFEVVVDKTPPSV